jgi:glycosyltransferase involved in cell wall biosynthesis
MRVLMVAATYFPSFGGVETHIHELCARLPAYGITPTVLTTDLANELPTREVHDSVEIIRVRAHPSNRDWYFAPGLRHVITDGKWDVVHCHGYHTFVPPIAMLTAWQHKIPYVLTLHSGGSLTRLRRMFRDLQLHLLRPMIQKADALIAVSEFERRSVAQTLSLSSRHFAVIPSGADLPEPAITRDRSDGVARIVSVGRLVQYKGHHRAVAAMPYVLEQIPNATLDIVGSGPFEPALRRQIADLGIDANVTIRAIPGSDRQGMADMLASADLVVLLSEYESQGIAAIEALSMKRPLVVADTSALSQLAIDGLARAIPLDAPPAATARAIVEELREPRRGVTRVAWGWDDCARSTTSLYQAIGASRVS